MSRAERDTGALLQAQDLSVGYGGKVVVGNVDFVVRAGTIVTLIGPNGAGKSTILKTAAGQLDPLGGSVLLAGRDLTMLSGTERAREMAVLLTERVHPELLTCADVVETGRYPHTGLLGVASEHDREQVRRSMELLEVWDLKDCTFAELSDGQRQRVMLARAVCQEPRVLILDEPTNHLDIRYQIELLGVLRHLAHDEGIAILMTLHELQLARRASDWLVCVKNATVMRQGPPEQVFVGKVIEELYDLEPGVYDVLTGDVALGAPVRSGAEHASA